MAKEKRVFERVFEPKKIDELLRGWVLHAHKGRDRHDLAARQLDKYHRWLGVPTSILYAIVGASLVFTAGLEARAQNTGGSSLLSDDFFLRAAIVVGLLSILSSALVSVQTFSNFAARAENHRAIGVQYKVIIRELEEIFAQRVQTDKCEDISAWLRDLRTRIDALEIEAPVVPHKIYDKIERKYEDFVFIEYAEGLRSSAMPLELFLNN